VGIEAVAVPSGERALAVLEQPLYDAVILGTATRGVDEFETLRQIKARIDIPVILVTDAEREEEMVAAYEMNADDYRAKPTELELAYRIRAIMKRQSSPFRGSDRLEGPEGLVMRVRAHAAAVGQREMQLTPKEFSVLQLLLERRGEVVKPDTLSAEIWGYETYGSRNYVEAHVSRLRSKLGQAGLGHVIDTVRGVGYVIR
jgi:DNA-binding response OmpR family regulator